MDRYDGSIRTAIFDYKEFGDFVMIFSVGTTKERPKSFVILDFYKGDKRIRLELNREEFSLYKEGHFAELLAEADKIMTEYEGED